MGFNSFSAIPQLFTAYAQKQESKNLKRVAKAQERLTNQQAEAAISTATQNQIYAQRNANSQLAAAHADAAASNLADEGSAHVREVDLATRLEKEITQNTNAALQQAELQRRQGLLNAWDTYNLSKQAKYKAVGSVLNAASSLISGMSTSS